MQNSTKYITFTGKVVKEVIVTGNLALLIRFEDGSFIGANSENEDPFEPINIEFGFSLLHGGNDVDVKIASEK